MYISLLHRASPSYHKAFTLIELLVVVGIFTLMTGLVLANYPRFDSQIVLENTAHEVAIEVRQAQSYGLGVRESVTDADAFPGYGIHIPSLIGGFSRSVFMYADIPSLGSEDGDMRYAGGNTCVPGSGECVEMLTLRNHRIYAICGNMKANLGAIAPFRKTTDIVASGAAAYCNKDSLDVTFTRPDPDAVMIGYVGGSEDSSAPYSDAEIVIATTGGDVRTVVIWSTGQITVE
ncbi:MAG: type II secretion system protein [Candidatus Yonathbacteria bacterium]|nr:type II secretion system protein [Candidatus Yonathbacteria bacterium]NTW47455.1 type II secretion system protein [Candidatus Yonathbacteria bacterium]